MVLWVAIFETWAYDLNLGLVFHVGYRLLDVRCPQLPMRQIVAILAVGDLRTKLNIEGSFVVNRRSTNFLSPLQVLKIHRHPRIVWARRRFLDLIDGARQWCLCI